MKRPSPSPSPQYFIGKLLSGRALGFAVLSTSSLQVLGPSLLCEPGLLLPVRAASGWAGRLVSFSVPAGAAVLPLELWFCCKGLLAYPMLRSPGQHG